MGSSDSGNGSGSGSGKLDYVRAHHSEDVVEEMEIVGVTTKVVSGVSSAASVVSGASAGSALRLAVVGQLCKLGQPMEERTYPLLLHPTQWVLFGSQAAGVVVGNFVITVAFWFVMCIVVQAVFYTGYYKGMDVMGLCAFPSSPLFVFQFLLQGTALGAMALLFYPPSTPLFLLGAASLMFCCVVPFYVLYSVCNGVPRKAYYLHDVDVDRKTWLSALIGPGEWVSRFETNMWSYRYAAVVRPYRQEWACYSFVEMAASLTVAAVDSTTAHSLVACGHQKTGSAVVFIVLLVAEIYAWPHARARDGYMLPAFQCMQASALLLMATGYYVENTDYWTFGAAAKLLVACAGVLVLKVVLDVCSEVHVYCTGRRDRLHELALQPKVDVEVPATPALEIVRTPPARHVSDVQLSHYSFVSMPSSSCLHAESFDEVSLPPGRAMSRGMLDVGVLSTADASSRHSGYFDMPYESRRRNSNFTV